MHFKNFKTSINFALFWIPLFAYSCLFENREVHTTNIQRTKTLSMGWHFQWQISYKTGCTTWSSFSTSGAVKSKFQEIYHKVMNSRGRSPSFGTSSMISTKRARTIKQDQCSLTNFFLKQQNRNSQQKHSKQGLKMCIIFIPNNIPGFKSPKLPITCQGFIFRGKDALQ